MADKSFQSILERGDRVSAPGQLPSTIYAQILQILAELQKMNRNLKQETVFINIKCIGSDELSRLISQKLSDGQLPEGTDILPGKISSQTRGRS